MKNLPLLLPLQETLRLTEEAKAQFLFLKNSRTEKEKLSLLLEVIGALVRNLNELERLVTYTQTEEALGQEYLSELTDLALFFSEEIGRV